MNGHEWQWLITALDTQKLTKLVMYNTVDIIHFSSQALGCGPLPWHSHVQSLIQFWFHLSSLITLPLCPTVPLLQSCESCGQWFFRRENFVIKQDLLVCLYIHIPHLQNNLPNLNTYIQVAPSRQKEWDLTGGPRVPLAPFSPGSPGWPMSPLGPISPTRPGGPFSPWKGLKHYLKL